MGVTVKWIKGVKKYEMPNGKEVAFEYFEYDAYGIGRISVETLDALMEMIGAKEIENDSNT